MENMTGSPKSPDTSKEALNYLVDQILALGGERIYQGFDERLARRQEEAKQAQMQQEMEKRQSMHNARLDEHYGNLKTAFEADPEYKELFQKHKMGEDDFRGLVEAFIDYKDKAPAMIKHALKNENVFNDLRNAENEGDARYLLSNIFADVSRDAAPQQNPQQNQQGAPEQPVKLPNPQLMPEVPTANYMDDEIANNVSRML